jgi:hypothetical protein
MTRDTNGSAGNSTRSDTERDDWHQYESPTAAVVAAVAGLTGRTKSTLPPLYDAVDTEAVNELVTSGREGTRVAFSYVGTEVVVDAGGTVVVEAT